jgi:hypothetical protein
MRNRIGMLLAASGVLLLGASPYAKAQTASGTPAFRVPIGGSGSATSGPATHAWMQNVSTCSSACGSGTRTTSYQCQDVSSYDFSGAGYGAPEADSFCSATSAKPSASTVACTNYSGCSYDWVKPAVAVQILPMPNPAGGTFDQGGTADCSYAKRTFSPYCERGGSPSVQMPAGDHAFCRTDTPDYDDVAAGRADALGYDRTTPVDTACTAGARDNKWITSGWTANPLVCGSVPTQRRTVSCIRKFNGATRPESDCAGITKPSVQENVGTAVDVTSCSYTWNVGSWGAYDSTCSNSTPRSRTVNCRRSDGATVADSQCASQGAKPATSESGSNLTGCTFEWTPATPWVYASTCSTSTSRSRTTSCRRSDGTVVADSSCSAGSRPVTSESGVSELSGCTYAPRDQGRSACTAQGRQDQYWDCTRSDGQTGFPASYCGKTNPESVACPPPPPVYTYVAQNRGESACTNGSKQVYWDCTRNDGATGFPASNCGKTSPETQGCLSYTPRNRGESACSGSQKQVYWDCLGSDGNAYPAANCGKSNPETQSCPMTYSWQWIAGAYGSPSGGCPGSTTRTRAVQCQRNDGYIDSDQFCNAGTRPASTETTACPYTWSWGTGGWSGYSSGCSASSTRTRSVYCQRNDGYVDSDQFCSAGTRPASSETTAVYSGCTYATEDTGSSGCQNGTTTYTTQCRRSDGNIVANSNCGNAGTRTESCPTGYPRGTILGTYAFQSCSTTDNYGATGTMPGIDPAQCQSRVATYARKCSNGGNIDNNANCSFMAYQNNPRGPSGYPCDVICR